MKDNADKLTGSRKKQCKNKYWRQQDRSKMCFLFLDRNRICKKHLL